jgi:ubiquinone/menaquinone biosynthesis C-methylase UbiE
MHASGYVHGYSEREAQRLADQAGTLAELLHHDTAYPPGARVLEAGCGTGCQSLILADHSPGAAITSVDISQASLEQARRAVEQAGHAKVRFLRADIFNLPFAEASFDHVFVCFVLEHLADPLGALKALKRMLRPGGSICVTEGDHGSCYFHP